MVDRSAEWFINLAKLFNNLNLVPVPTIGNKKLLTGTVPVNKYCSNVAYKFPCFVQSLII